MFLSFSLGRRGRRDVGRGRGGWLESH